MTNAGDSVALLVSKLDPALHIKTSSGRHTKSTSPAAIKKTENILHRICPFCKQLGCQFLAFQTIKAVSTERLDKELFTMLLNRNITWLRRGLGMEAEVEEEEEEEEEPIDREEVDLAEM